MAPSANVLRSRASRGAQEIVQHRGLGHSISFQVSSFDYDPSSRGKLLSSSHGLGYCVVGVDTIDLDKLLGDNFVSVYLTAS